MRVESNDMIVPLVCTDIVRSWAALPRDFTNCDRCRQAVPRTPRIDALSRTAQTRNAKVPRHGCQFSARRFVLTSCWPDRRTRD
jgi:hypothetical protein